MSAFPARKVSSRAHKIIAIDDELVYLARMQEREGRPCALGCVESPARPTAAPAFTSRTTTLLSALALAVLAGCASSPRPPSAGAGPFSGQRDGAPTRPPADLDRVPDAEPRVESLRAGGPNKPYEINGRRYEPLAHDVPLRQRGLASWYGRKFHGRRTANGEVYDMYAMTAAHPTMPLPSYAQVRNPANGREIVVRINDRGPFHAGRIIDLSYTAALKLDLLRGVGMVEVERITHEAIRTGQWKQGRQNDVMLARAAAAPTQAPMSVATQAATQARTTVTSVPVASAPAGGAPASPGSPAAKSLPAAAADSLPVASVAATSTTPSLAPAPPGATSAEVLASSPSKGPVAADLSDGARSGSASPSDASATASSADGLTPTASSVTAVTSGRRSGPGAPNGSQAAGFWVQLGVFRQPEGATSFSRQIADELGWVAPLLAVFRDGGLHRLQAGPFADRDQAQGAAERLRQALRLVPLIVEKR